MSIVFFLIRKILSSVPLSCLKIDCVLLFTWVVGTRMSEKKCLIVIVSPFFLCIGLSRLFIPLAVIWSRSALKAFCFCAVVWICSRDVEFVGLKGTRTNPKKRGSLDKNACEILSCITSKFSSSASITSALNVVFYPLHTTVCRLRYNSNSLSASMFSLIAYFKSSLRMRDLDAPRMK